MPHSHRWIESHQCWYCENHVYTLVLASKSICEKFYTKPRTKERVKVQQKIEAVQKKHIEKFQSHIKQDHRYIEHAGSDIDEHYYDAEAEDEPGRKNEYYRNN